MTEQQRVQFEARVFEDTVESIIGDIRRELLRAIGLHGPQRCWHEALGVILEEFDEFKDEVKRKEHDSAAIERELVQLGAMAARAILDGRTHSPHRPNALQAARAESIAGKLRAEGASVTDLMSVPGG